MGVRRLSFVFFCSRSAADLPSCIVIKKARPNSWNTSYRIGSRLDGFDRVTLRCPQGVYRVLQLPSFGFRGVHRVSLPMEKPVVLERSSIRDVYGVERSIEKTKKNEKKRNDVPLDGGGVQSDGASVFHWFISERTIALFLGDVDATDSQRPDVPSFYRVFFSLKGRPALPPWPSMAAIVPPLPYSFFFFGHRIDGWFRFDCRPFLSIDPNPGMTSSWLDFDRFSIVPSFTEFLWSDPLLHFYLKVSFQYWRWWFHFDCRSLFLIAPCLEWISNRFSLDSFKALPSFTELTLEPYSSSRLLIWFRLPIVPLSHSESRDDIKLTAYWCYRVFFLWPDLIDLGLCVVSSTLSI